MHGAMHVCVEWVSDAREPALQRVTLSRMCTDATTQTRKPCVYSYALGTTVNSSHGWTVPGHVAHDTYVCPHPMRAVVSVHCFDWVGVRITAEWRGAGPTSGLGVVLDLYKPKPKPISIGALSGLRSLTLTAQRLGQHGIHCTIGLCICTCCKPFTRWYKFLISRPSVVVVSSGILCDRSRSPHSF
jgi:hypothetical protein